MAAAGVKPAALQVELAAEILGSKLGQLLEAVGEQGGLEQFTAALAKKHALFANATDAQRLEALDPAGLEALLETVFTARKRLPAALEELGHQQTLRLMRELLHGPGPLAERMAAFVDAMPRYQGQDKAGIKAYGKLRRSAWDFAAELVHFRAPEEYPLMTRWVWDRATESGAMREFIRGNDTLRECPYDDRPETFEGVRVWMAEQLGVHGFYRDIPFLIDMVLGWAYTDYMRAMSSQMGLIEAEFGGKADATEPVKKLLGIDPARRGGQSRIKRGTVH